MVLVEVPGDRIIGPPGRGQQDDPGAHGEPVFSRAGSTEVFQRLLFRGSEHDRCGG
jgi:hypothetical protein